MLFYSEMLLCCASHQLSRCELGVVWKIGLRRLLTNYYILASFAHSVRVYHVTTDPHYLMEANNFHLTIAKV